MNDVELRPVRQWVTQRQGSLDSRLGNNIIPKIAHDLKTAVGRPKLCFLGSIKAVDKDVVEKLRRSLTDEGFLVIKVKLNSGDAFCSLEEAQRLFRIFAEHNASSDDAFCAFGDASALSVASFACGRWQQGMPLALIPTSMSAAVGASISPLPLSFESSAAVIRHDNSARITVCDAELIKPRFKGDDARSALVYMIATSMADDEKAFGRLWDRASKLKDEDPETIYTQLADTLRSRGRIVASSSVAVRQAQDFLRELEAPMVKLCSKKENRATILADTLRFLTRLGAACADFSVDDVLAIDELLEELGFIELSPTFSGKKMACAIEKDCFKRRNRLMLVVPQALGKCRLSSISVDVLREHTNAWVTARS